jgi:hypothetical protein
LLEREDAKKLMALQGADGRLPPEAQEVSAAPDDPDKQALRTEMRQGCDWRLERLWTLPGRPHEIHAIKRELC